MAKLSMRARLIAFYTEAFDNCGLSKSAAARLTGLPDHSAFRGIGEPDWNPRIMTAEKMHALIPEGWKPGDKIESDWFSEGAAA